MYTPAVNRIASITECHRLMRENSFATLVSSDSAQTLHATHIPLHLSPEPGNGVLVGHLAKANPHAALLGRPALAIFQGPHAYVSPSAYGSPQDVPTWNYLAVHAHGVPRPMPAERVREHLGTLVHAYEDRRAAPWSLDGAGEAYIEREMRGIVAFEMPIDRLEGKAKLSQNRTPRDRAAVQAMLSADPATKAVADAMGRFPPP